MKPIRTKSFWENKLNILDKIILYLRKNKVTSIWNFKWKIIADTWSWYNAFFLKNISNQIKKWFAIDLNVNTNLDDEKIISIKSNLNKKINLPNNHVDITVSMAILEHLEYPEIYLNEVNRILKKWWILVMTVPSTYSKPILEFLAFKLKIISYDEIKDHKKYYNKNNLTKILIKSWFNKNNIKHKYFQLWMNNFIIAKK